MNLHLTETEKQHPLWLRIQTGLEKRLSELRGRNDLATLTEAETAAIRGEIRAIKGFLEIGIPIDPTLFDDSRPTSRPVRVEEFL